MKNDAPRLSVAEWKQSYLSHFPELSFNHDDVIELALNAVYDMFSGVATIWKAADIGTYNTKTKRCYGLLACWYIAYTTPEWYPAGAGTTFGGFPIKSKRIGDVRIDLNTDGTTESETDSLALLSANVFGRMAKAMIKNSAARALIFGGKKW